MPTANIIFRDLDSPLDKMIAGASDAGVCFLEWHDRGGVERIKQRVEKRYKANLSHGTNQHLDLLERELGSYFDGALKEFTVPLAVTGTAFERDVWDRLIAIPYGTTRHYGQLADELGRPRAARAVGRACGANYLSIVIPCHRVLESGGGLRGYGGKLWRKKKLLELESSVRIEPE